MSNYPTSPTLEYRTIVNDSGDPGYVNRLLIGHPMTGLVRVEWMQGRYGQTIPTNWSQVEMMQYLNSYIPLRYQVDDAQNLIVKAAIEGDFQWVLFWEHDTVAPAGALVKLNQYMQKASHPVVSGLYYTRSRPSEPLIYRGRGTGAFLDWQMGDLVYADGVPTGFLLVHGGLLKAMWEDAEPYTVNGQQARRVFRTPRDEWSDPESEQYNLLTGTSDLDWCTRVMKDGYFAKSGWHEFDGREHPFLVDTSIFCKHLNMDGEVFP